MSNTARWTRTPLLTLAALSFAATAFAAPAIPEPGESLTPQPPAQPELESNLPTPQAPQSAFRFTLKEIKIEQPDSDCSMEKLTEIAAEAVGHEITVQDLDDTLTKLSAYCRRHGYPAAYAYVPEQKAKGGVLIVRIEPGRYGNVRLENTASESDGKRVEGLMAGLKSGDVIRSRELETALYNINELHGLSAAGVLSPGATEGTSDLLVRLSPGKKQTATLYVENYGTESSGRYRLGLQAALMGLGDIGGRLTVGGLISNEKLHNYNIGWDMPVGHSGTNLYLQFSRMDYQLGDIFSDMDAQGIANTLSIGGMTPLWRTERNTMLLNYGYDYRDLTDEIRTPGIRIDKHSHAFHAGIEGMIRPAQGTAMHYSLTAYMGEVKPDSEWGRLIGEAGRTTGTFTKGVLNLTGLQELGGPFDVFWKFSGQLASRNLDSSEQMYLGGAHSVRAYPQGEGSGDTGALGTLEFRYHTPVDGLTFSTYLDAGHVRSAKDGSFGSRTLKGWGLGLTYTRPDDWFARVDYARRIGDDGHAQGDAMSRDRFWFLVGKTF